MVALKKNVNATMQYGQRAYDFDEGALIFLAPNQVYSIQANNALSHKGWLLLIHPDLFWNTSLCETIKKYKFFDYDINEALHLSEKEESTIVHILHNIDEESKSNIDKFSKLVIVSHIETLLNYSNRFYHRQFITREKENHDILVRLEKILSDHFDNIKASTDTMLSVVDISSHLNVSPNYLSGLLQVLTRKSTQQHLHDKLIEKAKERLMISELSISEIAYELGFDYPQSFSKLFKSKTGQTPSTFRKSY